MKMLGNSILLKAFNYVQLSQRDGDILPQLLELAEIQIHGLLLSCLRMDNEQDQRTDNLKAL